MNIKTLPTKTEKLNLQVIIDNCKMLLKDSLVERSILKFQLDKLEKEYSNKFQNSDTIYGNLTKEEKRIKEKHKKEMEDLKKKIFKAEIERKEIFKHSFEWRFEYPEILDDKGNFIGFDLAIGNPPYIQLQVMGKDSDTLSSLGFLTFTKTGDIYALFIEKGMQILKDNGLLAFIISNKWMRAGYGEKLRDFIATKTSPMQLIDFGGFKVFDSATVDSNILITSKSRDISYEFFACSMKSDFEITKSIKTYFDIHKQLMPEMTKESLVISSNIENKIKNKIESIGTPLKEWDIKINYGIKTGFNDAFIIDSKKKDELIESDSKGAEIIKPILRGRDIKRYKAEFADLWLIMFPKGFTIKSIQKEYNLISEPDIVEESNQYYYKTEDSNLILSEAMPRYGFYEPDPAWNFIKTNYPAIANHLIKYKSQLEIRQDQGDYWWELRACAYLDDFEKDKIIYPNMSKFLPFVYDSNNIYANPKCYILTGGNLKYLLGLLNSKISSFWIRENCPELLGGTRELQKRIIENLPITQISIEAQQPFIDLVDIILAKKENNEDTSKEEKEIDMMVYKLYDLTEEEIKIVEGRE
jgi:hypothetical protein